MSITNAPEPGEAQSGSVAAGPQSARYVRACARRWVHAAIKRAVSVGWTRAGLNWAYNRLSTSSHVRLQARFAKIFRLGTAPAMRSGLWTVKFAGKRILLPLVPRRMWLDWDAALSTLGHEAAVKTTYATLLSVRDRPSLFIDVGANYGTHSLLFLVHGVDTLTIEPNSSCHEYFREACAVNGVKPRLEQVALGSVPGVADLCYPERETWLGSINESTVERLAEGAPLVRTRVPVHRLDDYLPAARGKRVLVKIDAEGHEGAILQGARRFLAEARPWILFESWASDVSKRRDLLRIFAESRYRIARVPLRDAETPEYIAEDMFLPEKDGDFIAIPES